jgi:regulatory protein
MTGEDEEEAHNRALKFLSYRARSAAEVRHKLSRLGFSKQTIDSTLQRLFFSKLLDDEAFARNWTAARMDQRGYGPLRVERELQAKGVDGSLAKRILQESFSDRNLKERVQKLVEKKFSGRDFRDEKTRRRAAAFLQRHGYGFSLIREVLGGPAQED